jgi:hypothetical protein
MVVKSIETDNFFMFKNRIIIYKMNAVGSGCFRSVFILNRDDGARMWRGPTASPRHGQVVFVVTHKGTR